MGGWAGRVAGGREGGGFGAGANVGAGGCNLPYSSVRFGCGRKRGWRSRRDLWGDRLVPDNGTMARVLPMLLLGALFAAAAPSSPVAVVRGRITTGGRITRVVAVDRAWADVLKTSALQPKDEFLYEGRVDEQGAFTVTGVLPGRSYDLIVWTTAADGTVTRWEGVDMDYCRSVAPSTPATADDRKAIEALIADVPQFYDKARALKMAADHQHATALVELIRTRDFHSEAGGTGGEVIYRVELWYFENRFGGWAKDGNTEKVIARVRGKPSDLAPSWQFLPQLGHLTAMDGTAAVPATRSGEAMALPEKPEAKNGVVGGIQ
jgi:hypothetical protein